MINKFPVKGEFGEYQVTIEDKYVVLGLYELVCNVEVKRENKRFYQSEMKTIHTYESGWSNYKSWSVDLVGLAIHTVNEYEDTIRFENEKEVALLEFEDWDGQIN